MEKRHLESAVSILKTIHYINIATVNEDGTPWLSPVSASFNSNLSFFWGSAPLNIHSKNIERDGRVFVVVYDSTVPEGTGEGIYMKGHASALELTGSGIAKKYQFIPQEAWINDVETNDDGSYKHDIRVELQLDELRRLLNQ